MSERLTPADSVATVQHRRESLGQGRGEMFGLSEYERRLVTEVIERHPEVREAKVFGSRALGTARHNSDIDLVLWGSIDPSLVVRIAAELDELPLPYLFDVVAYNLVQHPELRDHIDRVALSLYRS